MPRTPKKQERQEFNTVTASLDLISAMEDAIRNMTQELRKLPDAELSGSQRRSELQSYKEVAVSCKDLILERQNLIQRVKDFEESGEVLERADFGGGFAERYAKK